jgi:hypothetical protein
MMDLGSIGSTSDGRSDIVALVRGTFETDVARTGSSGQGHEGGFQSRNAITQIRVWLWRRGIPGVVLWFAGGSESTGFALGTGICLGVRRVFSPITYNMMSKKKTSERIHLIFRRLHSAHE